MEQVGTGPRRRRSRSEPPVRPDRLAAPAARDLLGRVASILATMTSWEGHSDQQSGQHFQNTPPLGVVGLPLTLRPTAFRSWLDVSSIGTRMSAWLSTSLCSTAGRRMVSHGLKPRRAAAHDLLDPVQQIVAVRLRPLRRQRVGSVQHQVQWRRVGLAERRGELCHEHAAGGGAAQVGHVHHASGRRSIAHQGRPDHRDLGRSAGCPNDRAVPLSGQGTDGSCRKVAPGSLVRDQDS